MGLERKKAEDMSEFRWEKKRKKEKTTIFFIGGEEEQRGRGDHKYKGGGGKEVELLKCKVSEMNRKEASTVENH